MSEQLSELCADVAQAGIDAVEWLQEPKNVDAVGAEGRQISRKLHRGVRRARALGRAAGRPMCVGVFGPSQAGKSFLVSVLGRPQGGRLFSDFPSPDGKLDYINQLNPEGEGESTGLVTRFTIFRYEAPDGFPVKLRLLSEADIGRVLANSFLMDGDLSEPEPTGDTIAEHLERLAARAGDATVPGLTEEDVLETQEYLEKNFGRGSYVTALKSFWDKAAEMAPKLAPRDRAELFSILWGGHEKLTMVYARLAGALAGIGHVDEVFVGIDALHPRDDSIIDVKLLAGLDDGDGADDGGAGLRLNDGHGREQELPRSIVTALTAELVMPIAEKPWDMFDNTDLLDFPGARSRFRTDMKVFLEKGEAPVKECYLRGKVAYLFDRYVTEQELTSMLLCIPPSNMEVVDLPNLVEDWINNTHGATSEHRANAPQILFFVFTKFDSHLVDSAGSDDDASSRFERRMESSLLQPFGRQPDSWPRNWANGQPFDNCYWLRNPNYPAEAVIDYDDDKRETGYIEKKLDRLAALRSGCLSSEHVQRHFREPERAWEAAMALNDGGVSYLVENLTTICQPETKERQIRAQLERLAGQHILLLTQFYIDDDLEKRLEERRAAADEVVAAVDTVFEGHRFGALLGELMLSSDKLSDRLVRTPDNVRLVGTRSESGGGRQSRSSHARPGGARPGRPRPGRVVKEADTPALEQRSGAGAATEPESVENDDTQRIESGIRTMSRSAYQAEVATETWTQQLRDLVDQPDFEPRLLIHVRQLNEVTGELIAGSRRFGLTKRIEAEIDETATQGPPELIRGSVALIAAEAVNRYVARLGADFIPLTDRPEIAQIERPGVEMPDGKLHAFAERTDGVGMDTLPEEPRASDQVYVTDWLFMLYRLFEDNAQDVEGSVANPEQNMKLGKILERLAAGAGADAGGAR